MNTYFAAYNDEGKIIGLYNTAHHKQEQIPQQVIKISNTQHLQIVARPNDFTVVEGRLYDSGASALPENAFSGAIMPTIKQPKHAAGFMYKDVCYAADDISSAHVTQCLVLSGLDNKHKFKVKTFNKLGEVEWKEVVFDDLKVIAAGINKLRSE